MTTPTVNPPASHGGIRAALGVLQLELETVLMHMRTDFSLQDAGSDPFMLDAFSARTMRAIAEGDERASLFRKELDSRGREADARKEILDARVEALGRSKEELEGQGASQVVWVPQAVAIVLAFAAISMVAAIALDMGTFKAVAFSVGSAIFGVACAYAVYGIGMTERWGRPVALLLGAVLAGLLAYTLADSDGLARLPRVVVTVAAVVMVAVGFAVTDGGLRTDAERARRRLLVDTTNGLAAAVNELGRVLPEEQAWVESVGGSLVELEQSHYVQAYHDFVEAASTLIARADATARKDLEKRRDELSKQVQAAIDSHLRHAVRPAQ